MWHDWWVPLFPNLCCGRPDVGPATYRRSTSRRSSTCAAKSAPRQPRRVAVRRDGSGKDGLNLGAHCLCASAQWRRNPRCVPGEPCDAMGGRDQEQVPGLECGCLSWAQPTARSRPSPTVRCGCHELHHLQLGGNPDQKHIETLRRPQSDDFGVVSRRARRVAHPQEPHANLRESDQASHDEALVPDRNADRRSSRQHDVAGPIPRSSHRKPSQRSHSRGLRAPSTPATGPS